MPDRSFLSWPFFEDRHRALAAEADAWASANLGHVDHADTDAACRALARRMGGAGLFAHAVPEAGAAAIDVRALCLLREILARHDPLADFVFAMQGLGSGAILLAGSAAQRDRFLPPVRAGEALAAFALSEPDAGSDAGAMSATATRTAEGWRLDGKKTWISNGGIAAQYVVFARAPGSEGTRGISAFLVPHDAPGLHIAARIAVIAPHPLAELRFENCRLPADALLGAEGEGFKLAMRTLDIFRPTVGAAALGLARRAFDEAIARARTRKMFGRTLGEMPVTEAKLAEMATAVDASALLVYRAAWARDASGGGRITREAAMAKLFATEAAQRVIDDAVQIWGGAGIALGNRMEALYREVRALRIYEGASEVQRLVIGRAALQEHAS
jgi:acyl-CoA dehydrogenase